MNPIMTNGLIDAVLFGIENVKAQIKELEGQKEKLYQELYNHMNEHEELISEDGEVLCTWKYAEDSEVFDTKRFLATYPDLHRKFLIKRPGTRRMLIK